ncbi:BTB/POZ domain-containing protein [Thalictrum thalictroides]|uniref:BTB/POZ domain-containing protein n=1 Tax=Thalictrum thalictroides TaxID=46969 RepID=A0A7J6X267_THATH|nr:BTB/POZ domain-containing protein [Thalictrum thalictroides]
MAPDKNRGNNPPFKFLEDIINPTMKRRTSKNRVPSEHMVTLHQRLYQALNLGIKSRDNEGWKWKCTDIEIQRLTVRSISAFVGCISSDMLQHPLVKDSVADMVMAMVGVTKSQNATVLGLAAEMTITFVVVLGNSIPFHQLSKLVGSFSCLLSFHQPSVASSCANALNHILTKLAPRRLKSHNEVWEILKESNAVDCIVCSLQDYIDGRKSYENFQEMASLLKTILWRWPPSRYPVWSNVKLMEGFGAICKKPDSSVEVVVLQLYSSIALCGSGVKKLLQNGETLVPMILNCMDSSKPQSVRVEAFKLTQSLVRLEQGWSAIAKTCSESIVRAIIDAIGGWGLSTGKVATDQVPLLSEACKLALITRWEGEHHSYFWKRGVDKVLLNLLVDNFYKNRSSQSCSSLEELIAAARKGLDANYLGVLRPFIWANLGWLVTHCPEDFTPDTHGNNCLDVLLTCGCLTLMDSLHKGRRSSLDALVISELQPASKAVLQMIHSPCKYIASKARYILSELSTPNVEVYLDYVLSTSIEVGNVRNKDQTVVDLIIFSCLSALPKYHSTIIQKDGIMFLSTFIKWCLINNASITHRKQSAFNCSRCCMPDMEDWEGEDTLLFFSLWGLAELMQGQHARLGRNHGELISNQAVSGVDFGGSDVPTLIGKLQEISGGTSTSPGLRWCATYILSYFGFYGFPSRFGKRIVKAHHTKELADVHLKLSSGECLRVHGVIVMVRCPSLIPSRVSPSNEKLSAESSMGQEIEQQGRNFRREVRLSARVDHTTLMELLRFVYLGFVQVDDDLVRQLKMLSRGCGFRSLSQLLSKKRPKWGTKVPCLEFTPALGPSGHYFSDIILQAKADEVELNCTYCSLSSSHIHVHKIILWLSCDYFKALFQSGMQESHSQTIEVPVTWGALSKLISWFYSDDLPQPSSGCIWYNMDVDSQLLEVHPYVELCWLAEFWLLNDLREDTLKVVISCLRSSRNLSLKIIQIAADLSQWEIVEVAANCLAPSFPHLRNSGDLESINEELVDMVRVAYVRLSQTGDCDYSD